MTEADFDALYDAMASTGIVHEPSPADPAWLAKSKREQEAARAGVEAEHELNGPTTGEKLASGAQGAVNALGLGLAPTAAGVARAAAPLALGAAAPFVIDQPISGIFARYRRGKEEQEAKNQEAIEQAPGAYGTGQLAVDLANAATGVAAPLRSAAVAAEDLLAGAPVRQAFTTGLAPVGNALRIVASKALQNAGSRANEARALTTMGATGGSINAPAVLREAERFPGGVDAYAEWLRQSGVSKGITTTSGIAKRAEALKETSGQAIGDMITRATKKGGVVDARQLIAELRTRATEATGGLKSTLSENATQADYLRRLADEIEKLAPNGSIALQDVKDVSIGVGKQAASAYKRIAVDKTVPGEGLALMDARRAYENAISRGIEPTGVSTKAEIDAAKRNYQGALISEEAANTSLGRAGKGGPISLVTATIGAKSAPLAAAYQAFKPLYASSRATALEAAQLLSKSIAPALSSVQVANIQRAIAAGNTPQMVSTAMGVPLAQVEAIAEHVAQSPVPFAAMTTMGQQQRPSPLTIRMAPQGVTAADEPMKTPPPADDQPAMRVRRRSP